MTKFSVCIEPKDTATETQQYAAEQLRRYLTRAAVSPEENAGDVFVIRHRSDAPAGGAFRLWVQPGSALIEAGEDCGLVYGVFTLLERMGFRFPAADCDVIPRRVELPDCCDEVITPAFRGRELFWREAMEGDFAVRLKLNSARSSITSRQGGKIPFYNFSHTFHQLVPAEKWYDTHPEYFSMVNGVRLREREQLCLSNPEVLALCVKGVETWAEEHPDCRIFSVSMNDWYHPCECPACRRIDEEEESQAGSVIRFVNAVAEKVAGKYPDIMIHTFAYLYCRKPPKHVRPAKNVIVRLCTIECCFGHPIAECGKERGGIDVQYGSSSDFDSCSANGDSQFIRDLRGWSEICENLFIWDYTVNYANYLLPFPNFNALAKNLQLMRQYGVKGVFEQGNFSLGRSSALGPLKIYLLGKLLWDPDEDVDALIKDFVSGYFAGAEGPMLRYVQLWRKQPGACHIGIYDTPKAAWMTDELIAEAETLLREALAMADNESVRERIRREALSPAYARLVREDPACEGHAGRVDAFGKEVKALGITELFERKDLDASLELMKTDRYVRDRRNIPAISYPI